MATPSEILQKTKAAKKTDDKDDKKESAKGSKRSALIDFIAKYKKG
jgi:hypothetical protein